MDVYFLSSQKTRPSLIGVPVIVPCDERTRNIDLYRHVWTQVSRLVSPLPPSENNASNHAQDWYAYSNQPSWASSITLLLLGFILSSCSDDSLKYEYPFTLKAVQKDGFTCAWCPWYRYAFLVMEYTYHILVSGMKGLMIWFSGFVEDASWNAPAICTTSGVPT